MPSDILIVDDSPVMREMLLRTVRLAGIEVGQARQAGNGAEALDLLRQRGCDFIILDLNMPVMDGEQCLVAIRGDPALAGTPVIVASTESSQTRIRRLRLLGAQFVHKPFKPELLAAAVRAATAAAGRAP